jgi:hypothetical protein
MVEFTMELPGKKEPNVWDSASTVSSNADFCAMKSVAVAKAVGERNSLNDIK